MTLDTLRYVIPQPTIFECFTPVESDNEEWILGDAEGRIYSLAIQNDGFIFEKLGEVQFLTDFLKIVLDTICTGPTRRVDIIHRIPFRRFTHRLPPTHSPSKTNHNHQSSPHIRFSRPPAIASASGRVNNVFRRFRTRNPPRCSSRCWN